MPEFRQIKILSRGPGGAPRGLPQQDEMVAGEVSELGGEGFGEGLVELGEIASSMRSLRDFNDRLD